MRRIHYVKRYALVFKPLFFSFSFSCRLHTFYMCTKYNIILGTYRHSFNDISLSPSSSFCFVSFFLNLTFHVHNFFPPISFHRKARHSIVFTILLSSVTRHSCLYFISYGPCIYQQENSYSFRYNNLQNVFERIKIRNVYYNKFWIENIIIY